jgi:hypothetical protein
MTDPEPSGEASAEGKLLAIRECPLCKETLRVMETPDGPVAIEQASDRQHVCWDLPRDANLLVL